MATPYKFQATFDPMSLDELLKVPMAVKEMSDKANAEYEKYADEYAKLKALAGSNEDAKRLLSNYESKMDEVADAFNGYYNGGIGSKARELRNMYREQVLPVGVGLEAMNKYNAERAKDQTAIGPEHSLQDFIDNPSLNNDWISGSATYNTVAGRMKAAVALRPNDKIGSDGPRNFYYKGYSQGDIDAAMNGQGNDELVAIVEDSRNRDGYHKMTDVQKETYDRYMRMAMIDNMGIRSEGANVDHRTPHQIWQENQRSSLQNQYLENSAQEIGENADGKTVYFDGNTYYTKNDKGKFVKYGTNKSMSISDKGNDRQLYIAGQQLIRNSKPLPEGAYGYDIFGGSDSDYDPKTGKWLGTTSNRQKINVTDSFKFGVSGTNYKLKVAVNPKGHVITDEKELKSLHHLSDGKSHSMQTMGYHYKPAEDGLMQPVLNHNDNGVFSSKGFTRKQNDYVNKDLNPSFGPQDYGGEIIFKDDQGNMLIYQAE